MANRQTTYIANEEVHHGWEHEPDDCRREHTWSTCERCEDSGWAYSTVEGRLVYCRCEVGQWERATDEYIKALNAQPRGGGAVEDAPASDEPGMVAASSDTPSGTGAEVAIR